MALLELLGRQWYRLARAGAPALAVAGEAADRFEEARRVLNLVAGRHLSGHRERWFPGASAGSPASPADNTCQVTNPSSQRTSRADGVAR